MSQASEGDIVRMTTDDQPFRSCIVTHVENKHDREAGIRLERPHVALSGPTKVVALMVERYSVSESRR